MNSLSLTLGLRKESVPWQQTDSIFTLTTAHLHRGEYVRKQQTQFLYCPTCLSGVKFTLTAKWQLLHFIMYFPNCEVPHDKIWLSCYILQHAFLSFTLFHELKLTQFLNSPACFPVVMCSLTANWQFLRFRVFVPWSVPWQKAGSVSTFSNILPRCEVLHDRKPEQFLHFLTCFPIVKYSVTENWLSFCSFQRDSPSWSVPWHQTDCFNA
jgi:hypothetical protein